MGLRRAHGRRLVAALFALSLAGCGTAVPSGTPALSSQPPPASPGPVVIDPSLLDHLPAQVDGLDVIRSPEFDAIAAADPVATEFAEAVVTALAIDRAAGDFAYATLVRLRPDVFTDDLYRSWRDSFDEGACSQAGGVARTAVAEISGRDVHIDSCEGGLRTFHAWLPNSRVLVSVSATGERRLGERLVAELRD